MTSPPTPSAVERLTADCNDGRQMGRMVVTSRADLREVLSLLEERTKALEAIEDMRASAADMTPWGRGYSVAVERAANLARQALHPSEPSPNTVKSGAEAHQPDPAALRSEETSALIKEAEGCAATAHLVDRSGALGPIISRLIAALALTGGSND